MNNPQQNIDREDDNRRGPEIRSNANNQILPRPNMTSTMNHTSKSIDEQFRVIQERIFATTPGTRPMAMNPGRLRIAQMLNARGREDHRDGSSGLNRFLASWSRNATASASSSEAKTENEMETQTETESNRDRSHRQRDQSKQGDENAKSAYDKSPEDDSCTGDRESPKDGNSDITRNDRKRKSEDTDDDDEVCRNRKPYMFERIRNRELTKEEIDRINEFAIRWNPSNRNKKRRKKRPKISSPSSTQMDQKKAADFLADRSTSQKETGPGSETNNKSEEEGISCMERIST